MRRCDHVFWIGPYGRIGLRAWWWGIALAACVAAPAWAQPDVRWFTIDGGGAMQTVGGPYVLGGTIGQPDSGPLSGGVYSLSGGFWVGVIGTVGVGNDDDALHGLPLAFRLHAPSPNPFGRRSVIAFDLPQARFVRVLLHDAAGRLARTLAEGPFPAGRHQRVWDGTDDGGRPVAAGIYLLHVDAERERARQKVVVLR